MLELNLRLVQPHLNLRKYLGQFPRALMPRHTDHAHKFAHLIGCAYRELKNYEKSLEAFKESRALFKRLKEVINVARCDQKIAHCLTELGDAIWPRRCRNE